MTADGAVAKDASLHLERLLEASRGLASTTDLHALLGDFANLACNLTRSQAAYFLLFDAESQTLRFEAASRPHRQALKHLNLPLKSSAAGWVQTHALPLLINDAGRDRRVHADVPRSLKKPVSSMICVPLRGQDQPLGVLEAVRTEAKRDYTDEDVSVLQALSGQAAVALENAHLKMKLRQVHDELARLDRMKSDFIAIASHELRTPLGLILGHATFLLDFVPDKYQQQMEIIIRSAMRLKELIEDMSAIAHKDQGASRVRKTTFSMSELIQDVFDRFSETAKQKAIALTFDVPPKDNLLVEGDREKIDLVLSNLVRNALSFTDEAGQVGVKAEESGGFVQVFVVDTGIGIPADEVDRVFDRFYQVESHLTRKHGGMGLGLSIAKAMVDMHNGQIWCESKEGVGSLFCFMLPANDEQAEAASRVLKTA